MRIGYWLFLVLIVFSAISVYLCRCVEDLRRKINAVDTEKTQDTQ